MAELTFKSPGVSTREIDLSGPRQTGPTGVPAGVIGTAQKGRAFIPLVFADFSGFVAEFGGVSADKFGPLALREWFLNARAGLYLKVLGVGDGKARTSAAGINLRGDPVAAGSVTNAGFVVGAQMVNPNTGTVSHNVWAGDNKPGSAAGGGGDGGGTITIAGGQNLVANDTITITSTDGTTRTFTAMDGAGTAANLTFNIARATLLAELKAAIEHANGFNAGDDAKVTAAIAGDGGSDEALVVTLTQKVAGHNGNTTIEARAANGTAAANVTVVDFKGGTDYRGFPGRTHFLGCLMKETAESAATATFTFAAGAVTADRKIKIISTDGTAIEYIAKDDEALGSNHFDRDGDATAKATSLAACINHSSGHNKKITAVADSGKVTLTQKELGREGNQLITSNLDNAGTVPAAFTGGKGERIFSEAGISAAGQTSDGGVKWAPVLRGVLMVPSGVVPALSASRADVVNNTPIAQAGLGATSARATITITNAVTAGNKVTIIDAAGLTRIYTAAADDGSENHAANPPTFEPGSAAGTAAQKAARVATDLAKAINADTAGAGGGHGGSIKATANAGVVTLVQTTTGVAGNTSIASTLANTTVSGFIGGNPAPASLTSAGKEHIFGPSSGYDNGGSSVGGVNTYGARQEFVMLLNGHKATTSYPNIVTASFDPGASNYFPKMLNTDPTAIQEAGHYLYTSYDIFSTYAIPSATDNPLLTSAYRARTKDASAGGDASHLSSGDRLHTKDDIAFLMPMAGDRSTGSATKANAENFSDRFQTAVSPTIISQKFGGVAQDLFKVHALDDGAGGNTVFKITIENIKPSLSEKDLHGTFDLIVRSFSDNDRLPLAVESFRGLSLNPLSDRYVARVIGDRKIYYDFDKRSGSQRIVHSGKFPNVSRNIRIEVADDVDSGKMDDSALPMGFRGMPKLNIDNTSAFTNPSASSMEALALQVVRTPPLPLRRTVGMGQTPKKRVKAELNWGIQFEADDLGSEPNKNTRQFDMMTSWTKYFPDFDQDSKALLERNTAAADGYNNNKFSLENIQVVENASNQPDSSEWAVAQYRRSGVLDTSIKDVDGNDASSKTRFIDPATDLKLSSVRRFMKFTTMVQGGFDGLEIFDKEKANMTDVAVMREVSDAAKQGGQRGPTAASYMKAVDVLAERSEVDIQLLAIPGIRQTIVSDRAIEAVEDRFDAMYIMDAIVYDFDNSVVTGSTQKVSVSNTVSRFSNRVLDTSFAAAYFPDVIMTDPSTGQNMAVPPSVPVLGAFALNDQLAHPWFAPAGFTRGAMDNVVESKVKLNRDNLDSLYEADINPLTSFPHTPGVVVFGQKTLLRTQSSLDRVNVRRLLIEIRRRVRSIANSFIFEPNRAETLARFSARVNPLLRQIQQQQGVDRFLVKIDTTTTTQNDVENNTLRGKIFLQPTRSVEFVSLDFVITNAGAEI